MWGYQIVPYKLNQLEKLEYLCSEKNPCRPLITHTIILF